MNYAVRKALGLTLIAVAATLATGARAATDAAPAAKPATVTATPAAKPATVTATPAAKPPGKQANPAPHRADATSDAIKRFRERQAAARKPPSRLVDINSATREQLKTLPGVHDAEADRIIAGRPYLSKAELVTKKVIATGPYLTFKRQIVAIQEGKTDPAVVKAITGKGKVAAATAGAGKKVAKKNLKNRIVKKSSASSDGTESKK